MKVRLGTCHALALAAALCLLLSVSTVRAQEAPTTVAEIRVLGNKAMSVSAVVARIKSRVGQSYSDDLVKEDVRRLLQTRRFDSVTTTREMSPKGMIITFVVVERPLVQSLQITGNKVFRVADLMKELTFNAKDPVDQEQIEHGRQKILDMYHEKGYYDATVTIDPKALARNEVHYRIIEGPQATVRKIVFDGNSYFYKLKLSLAISSKSKFWPFVKGYLDIEAADRDVNTLRNLYVEEGFLDAEVGREIVFSPDKKDVTLIFHIRQGPRFRVNEIRFVGNTIYTNEELQKRLGLHPGSFYVALQVERDLKSLQNTYGEIGFINADVKADRKFLPPNAKVPDWAVGLDQGKPALLNVLFTIREEDQYRLGRIEIKGNSVTQDRVIRREMRAFPTQLYNSVAIEESRRRLQEMGFFEEKSVTITPVGKEPGVRDALVQVKEGHTAQFVIGVGVNSNTGLVGNISFTQRNFDISNPGGWDEIKRGTAWKGAGQTFRLQAEPGLDQSRANIEWFTPYIGDLPYSFDTKAFYFTAERESYTENRVGLVNSIGHRFKNMWYGELANRIEGVNIDQLDKDAPPQVRADEGNSFLVGLKGSITRDRTDSRFLPSTGDRLRFSYEQVTGTYNFGVAEGDYRIYRTIYTDALDRKHILAGRIMAGQIFGDAPVFEKFYAGGLGSIRGFHYRGISPRAGRDQDPIGGNFTFFLGTEYSFPLIGDQLRGVIFIDSGTVEENFGMSNYRVSVGPGIRWAIPLFGQVPISVDLGFPLLKSDQDDTQIFSFSFGMTF